MTYEEYNIMERAHRKMWIYLAESGNGTKPEILDSIHYRCTACQVAIDTLGKKEGRCVCCPVTEWRLRAIANPTRYYDSTPCILRDTGGADIFHQWEHCLSLEVRKALAAQIRDMEWSYISTYKKATLDTKAIQKMQIYLGLSSYIERQNKAGFKVGDYVTITRIATAYEDGWPTFWVPSMTPLVGEVRRIIEIDNYGITIEGSINYFPFFVLEKVAPVKTEAKMVAVPKEDVAGRILSKYRSPSGTVDDMIRDIIAYVDEKTYTPDKEQG